MSPAEKAEKAAGEQRLLDDLFDEHEGWFPSVDVCARCGDCYCDGIGCIAAIDPDNADDHERLEDVQDLIRQGNAWRLMQRLIAARPELDALALANYALANTQGFHPLPELPDLDPVGVSCYSCPNGTTQSAEQRPEGGWTYEEHHGWRCPTCAEQVIASLRIDAREAEREARSAERRCEIYAAALREIVEPSGYRPSVDAAQRVARQALRRVSDG